MDPLLGVLFLLLGLKSEAYTVTGYAVGDGLTPGAITTSGTALTPGRTAACSANLPLGTPIYIENLGVRLCEDRGYLGERHIDVAFETKEEALAFGRQDLEVVVWDTLRTGSPSH